MARRHYSSNARETSLTAGVNSSATTIAVDSPVGYPAEAPFMVHCELGTSSEEILLVTAMVGDQWTVERGYDGSTAVAHDLGAKIVHGVSAIDMDEANEHVQASTDVHGLASGAAVVGTTTAQTLTNKILTSPTLNGGTLNAVTLASGTTLTSPTLVTPTIASFVNATHTHEDAASGGVVGGGSSSSVVYKRTGAGSATVPEDETGLVGEAITFGTLGYSTGNDTWSTASSNARIVLPTDIADGYWSVSAGLVMQGIGETFFALLVHQDLGIIARQATYFASLSGGFPQVSLSTDFRSDAGRWLELRVGSQSGTFGGTYTGAYMALHRIA